MGELLVVAVEA